MQARYNAIRKVDKTHLITAHAVGASLPVTHVGAGATDDFLMARHWIITAFQFTRNIIIPNPHGP